MCENILKTMDKNVVTKFNFFCIKLFIIDFILVFETGTEIYFWWQEIDIK